MQPYPLAPNSAAALDAPTEEEVAFMMSQGYGGMDGYGRAGDEVSHVCLTGFDN